MYVVGIMEFFWNRLGEFIEWLNSMFIVNDVSLLWFFGGLILLYCLIHNLLFRAK